MDSSEATGTLVAANAFWCIGFIAVVSAASLLSSEMTGSDRIAGIPSSAATSGTAFAAARLARLSPRRGRWFGLRLGYIPGVASCVVALATG
jgi:hypothetical protein